MFNLFKKKESKPENPFPNLRTHFMGNVPLNEWPKGEMSEHPWSLFAAARKHLLAKNNSEAEKIYRQIIEAPGLEPRHYMQAWMFMRYFLKIQPPAEISKQVYGVMVEVFTPTGIMLVVAYADHKARSLHSSGGGVIWEKPNDSLNEKVEAVIKAGENAVKSIPLVVVDVVPKPPAQVDHILICIATPAGIYHGLGTGQFLSNDPYAGPIVTSSGQLLQGLESLKK